MEEKGAKDSLSITVDHAVIPVIEILKVVGDETNIVDFHKNRMRAAEEAGKPKIDWSALYLQFNEPHTLGTIGYRWDQKYECANLLRAVLYNVDVVIARGAALFDGNISGTAKARALKAALGIDDSELLMDALGKRNLSLLCQETEHEWELIVADALVPRLFSSEDAAVGDGVSVASASGDSESKRSDVSTSATSSSSATTSTAVEGSRSAATSESAPLSSPARQVLVKQFAPHKGTTARVRTPVGYAASQDAAAEGEELSPPEACSEQRGARDREIVWSNWSRFDDIAIAKLKTPPPPSWLLAGAAAVGAANANAGADGLSSTKH